MRKRGLPMKKFVPIVMLSLAVASSTLVADELEDMEISLTDDRASSTFKQTGPIVGCDDNAPKKEMSCAKEPAEAILSKLPTSTQIDSADFDKEEDLDAIKQQLASIVNELNTLKEQRAKDQETIGQLQGMIQVLSDKKATTATQKSAVVKQEIQTIVETKIPKKKSDYISGDIKVLEEHGDYVLIEVQNNESLSSYAEAFYGDKTKYYQIYKANKDVIPDNLEVIIGTQLKIPLVR